MAPSVQRRKVWLTPTTRCRAVTLPRRETRWNLKGCLKLPDRSQPLVGRSSPYYEDMWRTYRCLIFFAIVDIFLSSEDIAKVVRWCPDVSGLERLWASQGRPGLWTTSSEFTGIFDARGGLSRQRCTAFLWRHGRIQQCSDSSDKMGSQKFMGRTFRKALLHFFCTFFLHRCPSLYTHRRHR